MTDRRSRNSRPWINTSELIFWKSSNRKHNKEKLSEVDIFHYKSVTSKSLRIVPNTQIIYLRYPLLPLCQTVCSTSRASTMLYFLSGETNTLTPPDAWDSSVFSKDTVGVILSNGRNYFVGFTHQDLPLQLKFCLPMSRPAEIPSHRCCPQFACVLRVLQRCLQRLSCPKYHSQWPWNTLGPSDADFLALVINQKD